jgi:hypothetical protein
VEKIKIVNLAAGARNRLDQAFPEEDGSVAEQAEKRHSLVYALSKLRPLASSMEWKVPVATLREYLRELAHVRAAFSDDKDAVLLIRIQQHLCRRIAASPAAVNPGLLTLLRKSYGALEVLAYDPIGSTRRSRAVKQILEEYAALGRPAGRAPSGRSSVSAPAGKAAVTAGRPAAAGGPPRGPRAGAGLESRSYYLIPVDQLNDLKSFIRSEIDRLQARILGPVRNR